MFCEGYNNDAKVVSEEMVSLVEKVSFLQQVHQLHHKAHIQSQHHTVQTSLYQTLNGEWRLFGIHWMYVTRFLMPTMLLSIETYCGGTK